MIDWLVELIQEVWKTRQVLQEWKNATLVPLHEKKDQKECKNYRGISLLSISGKVITLVLLERMRIVIEPQLSETQRGFRKGRGTVGQIWVTRQVMEKAVEEVAGTLGGGLLVEYTTAGGLFLTYRDQTKAATLIQDVLYADDLTLIAELRSELQHMLDVLDGACSCWGMTINVEKTKVLTVGDHPEAADQTPITLQSFTL